MLGDKSARIIKEDKEYISQSLVRQIPLVVKKGKNTNLWDLDGKEYLDFLSGAAVTNVGRANENVIEAVKNQMEKLIHPAIHYHYNEEVVKLAKKLSDICPGEFKKRVFFGTSGSGAIDAALKMVKSHSENYRVITFRGNYHGMTCGAQSLSSFYSSICRKCGPLLPGVYRIPFPNLYRPNFGDPKNEGKLALKELEETFDKIVPPQEVAALFVEPIQGDNGFIVPPKNFLKKLKSILDEYNIPMVSDEIQTGFGRTGKWFAMEHFGVEPEVTVLGKAIASGFPLSAVISKRDLMDWSPGSHVITCGGSSVPVAAALETIKEIKRSNLVQNARKMGRYLKKELNELRHHYDVVGDVRGKGLMLGVDLVKNKETKEPAKKYCRKACYRAWELGLVMITMGESVLRIAPPLTINSEEIDKALNIIDKSLDDVGKGKVADNKLEGLASWK